MIERLDTYPGVHGPGEREGYFERAYRDADLVARVRFRPFHVPTGLEARGQLPSAAAPRAIGVQVSASLVDADGAVLALGGRLLVRDTANHTRSFEAEGEFDADAWLDRLAGEAFGELQRAYRTLSATAFLIVPPSGPVEPSPAIAGDMLPPTPDNGPAWTPTPAGDTPAEPTDEGDPQ